MANTADTDTLDTMAYTADTDTLDTISYTEDTDKLDTMACFTKNGCSESRLKIK